MEITVVSPTQIEASIQRLDFKKYELNVEDLSYMSNKLDTLIKSICSKSYALGVDFNDKPLMIDLKGTHVNGNIAVGSEEDVLAVMTISCVSTEDLPEELRAAFMEVAEDEEDEYLDEDIPSLFTPSNLPFPQIEPPTKEPKAKAKTTPKSTHHIILCKFSTMAKIHPVAMQLKPIIKGENMLYKVNDYYVLAFKISKRCKINMEQVLCILSEYCEPQQASELEYISLYEHGKLVAKSNALKLILTYY